MEAPIIPYATTNQGDDLLPIKKPVLVDFLAVRLPLYDKLVPASGGWWPAFNVADSCICVAACLLFLGGLREENKPEA